MWNNSLSKITKCPIVIHEWKSLMVTGFYRFGCFIFISFWSSARAAEYSWDSN